MLHPPLYVKIIDKSFLAVAATITMSSCFYSPTGSDPSATHAPASTSSGTTTASSASEGLTIDLTGGLSTGFPTGDLTTDITTGPASVCGNRVVEAGEECDDSNMVDSDACTNACTLAICGDGVTGPGETCDDGNQVDDDDCTNACGPTSCGDGKVQSGEECDDGNPDDTDMCISSCKLALCGDGFVEADGEACDDANDDDTDACTSLCKNAVCGDGNIWAGMEECDSGAENGDTMACTAACKLAVCGDNLVLKGMEECDDGNFDNEDGCIGTCNAATCGDKFVQKNVEACDDGNGIGGDGCTMCNMDCGNGKVDMGNNEECDDGNDVGGDTCDSQCKRLAFMVFVSSMKWKGDLGGLAGADAKCNTLAAGKLPGTYMAWISDGFDEPSFRLDKSTKPYIRPDKVVVANSWTGLTTFDLINALNRNENNQPVLGNGCNSDALVWTNTLKEGTAKGSDHCQDWNEAANFSIGASGVATVKSPQWTDACSIKCDVLARIYCFEQPVP